MGWTVYFHIEFAEPLSSSDKDWVLQHVADPRWTLDRRSEPYALISGVDELRIDPLTVLGSARRFC